MLVRVLMLVGVLSLVACAEEEETTIYTMESVTCDDVDTSVSPTVYSMSFTGSTLTVGLGGVSVSPAAACSGTYPTTTSTFSGADFTFTRPAAAASCLNIDATAVDSCNVGGVACDTAATGDATTVTGTYTQDATTLVLTYESTGDSFCASGETEVVTFEASAE